MSSIDRLKSYLLSDPSNAELTCELIDAMFAAGQYPQAKTILDSLPAEAANAAGVRFRRGRLNLMLGEYQDAESGLLRLESEGHESAAISHDIAFSQLCQRRTIDAANTLAKAVETFGVSPELRILQARIALMDKDYLRAQLALTQALRLEPGQPVALGLQALALLDSGQADEAEKQAESCLTQYPDQHEALLTAGTTALWKRDVQIAESRFTRALSRFPNSGRALSGYAQVLMLQGKLEEALPQLEHAVAAMPDHIGSWHALAWVQLLQGDLAGARTSYQMAYQLDRNFAETHGGLAVVAMLDERVDDAEESMRRALKLDPDCINGRYAKSLWLESQGQEEAAANLMAEVMIKGALPGANLEQARKLSQGIRDRVRNLRKP